MTDKGLAVVESPSSVSVVSVESHHLLPIVSVELVSMSMPPFCEKAPFSSLLRHLCLRR